MSRLNAYWVLDDEHRAVEVADVHEWGRFFEDHEKRRVNQTQVGEANVSTVFLGMDHGWGAGPPVLFETMIFHGPYDQGTWRWRTWDEAEAGHAAIVAALEAGGDPEAVPDGEG